jgi:hypothetical protein
MFLFIPNSNKHDALFSKIGEKKVAKHVQQHQIV